MHSRTRWGETENRLVFCQNVFFNRSFCTVWLDDASKVSNSAWTNLLIGVSKRTEKSPARGRKKTIWERRKKQSEKNVFEESHIESVHGIHSTSTTAKHKDTQDMVYVMYVIKINFIRINSKLEHRVKRKEKRERDRMSIVSSISMDGYIASVYEHICTHTCLYVKVNAHIKSNNSTQMNTSILCIICIDRKRGRKTSCTSA